MFKKILFYMISTVVLSYGSFSNEVGLNVATTSITNENSSKFSDYGFETSFQMSRYIVRPRFDFDYVNISNYSGINALFKGSINAVYEFENRTRVLPYGLIGLGYEYLSPNGKKGFENNPFVQMGAGLAYKLNYGYKMHFEAKKLQILSGDDDRDEVILSLGISFSLGKKRKRVAKRRKRRIEPLIPVLIH